MSIATIAAERGAKVVEANGIEIAYAEVGDGPPLVLLHGGMASTGPAWAGSPVAHVDHFAALGKHFRVIAPDTRGSGATVHPGGPATFDVLADDVRAMIDALALDRPMLAGFSEGAATATVVALRHPDVVGALVNHAGFHYFGGSVAEGVRHAFGGSPDATKVDLDATEAMFRSAPPMAAVYATMKADYDSAQGAGYWRRYLDLFFARHVAPLGYSVEDLGDITSPTLILAGDRDMFCPAEDACAAYRSLPAGELGIVPGTGHEITAALIDTMIDFFTRHAETRPS